MSTNSDTPADPSQKDVPLGPACMVVFVCFLIGLCIVIAIMAYMLTGNQGKRAATALRKQLIPWVDESSLSKTDQSAIIEELNNIANMMERDQLTPRQLTRLGVRLSDSPILQWGTVEQVLKFVQTNEEFNATEREEIQRTCDRWLRCAAEGKLSMTEMDFAFQGCAAKDPRSGRMTLRPDVTTSQIREFHRRVLGVCDKYKIDSEPFDKSISQVFHSMIEDGLAEK